MTKILSSFIIFIFVVPLILVIFLIIKLTNKQKQTAWKGSIIDKKYVRREDPTHENHQEDIYSIVYRTDEGQQVTLGVSGPYFDQFKIGDRVEKRKDELLPVKI